LKKHLLTTIVSFIFILISAKVYAQRPVYGNQTFAATVGVTSTNTPNHTGGNAATSFAINPTPTLPAGLTFSTSTGVITGIPTTANATQVTYTITPSNSSGAGTAFTVKITVAKGTITITANNVNKTYGTAITSPGAGSTAFTVTGLAPGASITSVTMAYSTGTGAGAPATANAGTYTGQVTPSAAVTGGTYNAANYNTPFTYTKGNIIVGQATLTVTASNASRSYGAANPTFTLNYSGWFNGDGTGMLTTVPTGATTATTASNVGTYAITVSGGADNNYTFSYVPGTLTIGTANLTINATSTTKAYGTALANPATGSSGFTSTGLQNGQTIKVTLSYSAGALATDPAGTTGVITASSPSGTGFSVSNYNISYNTGTLTVGKATLSVDANDVNKTYGTTLTGGSVTTGFTPTGLQNGETIGSVTIAYGTGSAATAGVATYNNAVTISGATGGTFNPNNYSTITYTQGNINVTQANLTITATTNGKTYGTTLGGVAQLGTAYFTTSGLVNGETISQVYFLINTFGGSPGTANVGTTYTAQPGDLFGIAFNPTGSATFNVNNYNITFVAATQTIVAAPLTIAASNVNKTYGTTLTSGVVTSGFTPTGLQNGETITSITMNYGAGAAATAAVGTYTGSVSPTTPIVGSATFRTSNYNISYTTANIIVGQANLTISATPVNKPFNTTLTNGPSSTGFTSSGLVNSEAISTVFLTYVGGTLATDPIGTTGTVTPSAPVTGSGTFNAGNYNITFKASTVVVGAAVFDWTGAVTTDWATPGNWDINGVPQTTTYPGLNEATDIVQIGVVAFNAANQPDLAATLSNPVASLNFGSATTPITLSLNASAALTVTGNTTLNTGTETVNLNGAAGSSLNIGGNFTTNTGTTFNNISSGVINISGNFINAGTSNFGTALLTFNSPAATTLTTTAAATFTNVAFTGGGTKTLTSGAFNIASTGVINLGGNTTLATGGLLTLKSDVNSSASVAAIPTGCQVTGAVNVQRYMSAVRGYRLMSSPVNAGTTTSIDAYSVNYLKTSVPITGTNGITNGFDKSGNPTLYLYREDVPVVNSSFNGGNFRGIGNLTLAPSYTIDIDGAGFNIPVSNGYMLYYRGSKNQKTLAALTVAGATATTDTVTATGLLNQGAVVFKDWYNNSSNTLGFSNPDVTAQGFNLVANPYASSIDWETFSSVDPTAGIYAQNTTDYVYKLNLVTQNYDVYEKGGNNTNGATNTILSGEGFFMLATGTGATLTINETAKNTALQSTGPNLYMSTSAAQLANNQYLRLQLALDTINKDDMMIRFNNTAKSTFDVKEDAPYKKGSGKVSLASMSSDHTPLAINQMPLNQRTQTIALNTATASAGLYTLNMTALQGIPQLYDIWLMDAYKKDSLDMRHNKSYAFNTIATDTGSYSAHRFTLVLRQNPAFAYHLLNFTAVKAPEKQVQLGWATENEANYTNFTVERSIDGGKTFDVIGSAASNGAGVYSLIDKDPMSQNLYRLKQEDFNGSITYSHIITIEYSNLSNSQARGNINSYPNPTTSLINVTIGTLTTGTYNIQITNSAGLIMKQAKSTQATWQSNVSNLMPGTYYIQVLNSTDNSMIGQTKFIKL